MSSPSLNLKMQLNIYYLKTFVFNNEAISLNRGESKELCDAHNVHLVRLVNENKNTRRLCELGKSSSTPLLERHLMCHMDMAKKSWLN